MVKIFKKKSDGHKNGIYKHILLHQLVGWSHYKDAARAKSGVHESGQFGQKVELLSFPTVVSTCKSDHY